MPRIRGIVSILGRRSIAVGLGLSVVHCVILITRNHIPIILHYLKPPVGEVVVGYIIRRCRAVCMMCLRYRSSLPCDWPQVSLRQDWLACYCSIAITANAITANAIPVKWSLDLTKRILAEDAVFYVSIGSLRRFWAL